jgi:nucleoside-diphosphate kinase
MTTEKTLIVIKPDGVKKKLIGESLRRFEKEGLNISHLETKKIKKSTAHKFYGHLKKKLHPHLFKDIIKYITSGKVVLGLIEGENAAERVRNLVGPTNPKKAPKGTIRGDFGEDDMEKLGNQNKVTKNIIHASESHRHAKKEFKILKGE